MGERKRDSAESRCTENTEKRRAETTDKTKGK